MKISQLETPCLILDKNKLMNNIQRFNTLIKSTGINLRPHGKTAKNIDVLRLSIENQFGGITVSTLKEAEYYYDHGINDIVYAVGIAPVKMDRIINLIKKGAKITILLDTIEQAEFVSSRAVENNIKIPVNIEIDSDGHRSGVKPGDPILVEIAGILHHKKGTILNGILTHAGASYQSKTIEEIKRVATEERNAAVKCAGIIRQNNLPCPVISIGSTPTATFSGDLTGITEIRAGVYMFMDMVMAGLKVCETKDIAISVLASVIGHQKQKGWIITDAGWTALSGDRGTAKQEVDQGYGLVCNIDGVPDPDMIVSSTNQEHGIITRRNNTDIDFDKFPVGSMVRILPNHACATAAMHDRYHVVENSSEVVEVWSRINGW
jgi:D-serine deaminase-like pyridoxal phosphate-dependent protein